MYTHEQPYMRIIKPTYTALIMHMWVSAQKPLKHRKQSKVQNMISSNLTCLKHKENVNLV